jgi:transposase
MMEYKIRNLKTFTSFCLEPLVPEDNSYSQVENCIHLTFMRNLVCHLYSAFGRPSIDSVVFFKLELIGFFEGIRSERQLMETVRLNLAHSWFIGYDLDEDVPDHSSLSNIRERYGIDIYQQFF